MAVKHKEVECVERPVNGNKEDSRVVMLRCVEKFRNEPQSMPQGQELISLIEKFVHILGLWEVPRDPNSIVLFVEDVIKIQDFLASQIMTSPLRKSLIIGALGALYTDICDANVKPKPAMSIVLQLVEPNDLPVTLNLMLSTNPNDACLEQALMTLCSWLANWTKTPNLGKCVMVFLEGLEAQKRYDILINVTLNIINTFFSLLMLPLYRASVGPIVLKMLSSVQDSAEVFHKVIPHVPDMIAYLNREESECSLTYLQDIVNLCTALMEHFPGHDVLYKPLLTAFKSHPPSPNYRSYLSCSSWANPELTISLHSKTGKVGLNNLGNTCYMNSVLQALFMTKLFTNNVLVQKNRWPLMSKLQNLFALLQFSKRNSLSPSEVFALAKPPGFQLGHQHDSSEFLGYLMDTLHEQEKIFLHTTFKDDRKDLEALGNSSAQEVSSVEPPPPTVVQCAFGGRAEIIYKCDACQGESIRADNFRDLQLSFPSDFVDHDSVQTLLEYYLKPERLCGENQYHCERCGGLSDAERVFHILQCPPRLILTMKHFRYDAMLHQRMKLLHRVQYSPVIYLDGYGYELYAAVVHCGSSVDSGHYYTYAKDKNSWFKFNDSYVKTASANELFHLNPPESPYILFYSRQDCIEPEPVSRMALPPLVRGLVMQDNTSLEMETLGRRSPAVSKFPRLPKDDPPPGCGGSGDSFGSGGDRFIC